LSYDEEWKFMPTFKKIELAQFRGDLKEFDSDKYCYSSISPFVAIHHAYKLGATEIILYGVDLINHQLINTDPQIAMIKRHFWGLNQELNKRKVHLLLGTNYGALVGIIPSL